MTPSDRARLRELCEAAASPDWSHVVDEDGTHYVVRAGYELIEVDLGEKDAAFIAAARTAVPELLDALDALESEVARLKSEVSNVDRWLTEAREQATERGRDLERMTQARDGAIDIYRPALIASRAEVERLRGWWQALAERVEDARRHRQAASAGGQQVPSHDPLSRCPESALQAIEWYCRHAPDQRNGNPIAAERKEQP